jgi:hypothetical protein
VIVFGIAAAVCWAAPAPSATIKSLPGKNGGVVITLSCQIITRDSGIFISETQRANAAGKSVENVQLNSAGGRLIEGVKLAAAVREAKISTTVGQGAVCASACFLVFAAGDPTFVSDGARIGVHKAADKDGRETMLSGAATGWGPILMEIVLTLIIGLAVAGVVFVLGQSLIASKSRSDLVPQQPEPLVFDRATPNVASEGFGTIDESEKTTNLMATPKKVRPEPAVS